MSCGGTVCACHWNRRTSVIGEPLPGHAAGVGAIAIGRLGDRDVIVSGGLAHGDLQIWDSNGQPISDRLPSRLAGIAAIAVGRLGGHDVIIAGGFRSGDLQIWDRDGQPIGEPSTGHTDRISTVMVGRLGEREVIISSSADRTVRIWDRSTATSTILDALEPVSGVTVVLVFRGLTA